MVAVLVEAEKGQASEGLTRAVGEFLLRSSQVT